VTRLTRTVRRLVRTPARDLVVALEPPGVLVLREPRRRHGYELELGALFFRAVAAEVEAARAARRHGRRRRRG
jgi:hypothetical protein